MTHPANTQRTFRLSRLGILLAALLVMHASFTRAQGTISGMVLDDKNEPLINATIQVYQLGVLKWGNITDIDGNYTTKPLEPGNYDMLVLYEGYDSIKVSCVVVSSGQATTLNFQMLRPKSHPLQHVDNGVTWRKPLAHNTRRAEVHSANEPIQLNQDLIAVNKRGKNYVEGTCRAEETKELPL